MGRTGNTREYLADANRALAESENGGNNGGGGNDDGENTYNIVELTFGSEIMGETSINYAIEDTGLSFSKASSDLDFLIKSGNYPVITITPGGVSSGTDYRLKFGNITIASDTIVAVIAVEDYTYNYGHSSASGKFKILINDTLYDITGYFDYVEK